MSLATALPLASIAGAKLARATRWLRLRRGRRELNALPDHMLKDMGISRGDIDFVVRHGRESFNRRRTLHGGSANARL